MGQTPYHVTITLEVPPGEAVRPNLFDLTLHDRERQGVFATDAVYLDLAAELPGLGLRACSAPRPRWACP